MRTAYYTLTALVILLFSSCKNEQQEREEKSLAAIKTYLTANFPKAVEDYQSLDSLRILLIDTVTQKSEMNIPINYAMSEAKRYNRLGLLQAEIAKHSRDIANLGSTMYGGTYVNNLQYEEANKAREKVLAYADSAKLYLNAADSLYKAQETADSTTLKYFAVRILYQFSRKDNTFERDTTEIALSKDYRIIERDQINREYLKGLY